MGPEIGGRCRPRESAEAPPRCRVALEEARATFERETELTKQDVAATAALDRAEATLNTVQAELARSRQSVEEVEAARGHATIRAPFDGRVIHRVV